MGKWQADRSSGLLTNFVGTVKESWFDFDANYNNGETLILHWEVSIDEVLQDFDGDVPETTTVTFPCGSGWTTDDGRYATHPRGKQSFHASSIAGKLVDAAAGLIRGYGDNAVRTDGEELQVELSTLLPTLVERGGGEDGPGPLDAEVWKDLTFEFAEIHFDYGTNKAGERISTNRTMPIRPVETSKPAAKKTTGKKTAANTGVQGKVAAAKAKAAANAKADTGQSTGSPFAFVEDEDVRARLDEALAGADSYETFVEALLQIPEVADDAELLDRCLDEDGPWATRNA